MSYFLFLLDIKDAVKATAIIIPIKCKTESRVM